MGDCRFWFFNSVCPATRRFSELFRGEAPKIFEILGQIASRNDSDNKGKYMLLGVRGLARKIKKSQENWSPGTNLTIKEDDNIAS